MLEKIQVERAQTNPRVIYCLSPQSLVGVQSGGVGGQPIYQQTGVVLGQGKQGFFENG
jgi:hypothetical protein